MSFAAAATAVVAIRQQSFWVEISLCVAWNKNLKCTFIYGQCQSMKNTNIFEQNYSGKCLMIGFTSYFSVKH